MNYLMIDAGGYVSSTTIGGYAATITPAWTVQASIVTTCPQITNAGSSYNQTHYYGTMEMQNTFSASDRRVDVRVCIAGVPSSIVLTPTWAGTAMGLNTKTLSLGNAPMQLIDTSVLTSPGPVFGILLPDGNIYRTACCAFGMGFSWALYPVWGVSNRYMGPNGYSTLPVDTSVAQYVMGF